MLCDLNRPYVVDTEIPKQFAETNMLNNPEGAFSFFPFFNFTLNLSSKGTEC